MSGKLEAQNKVQSTMLECIALIYCLVNAEGSSKGTVMRTTLAAFAALMLAGSIYVQPTQAQVQVQPAPGFSVQIGPSAPPPPREEWRDREGYYGSGWDERREERWRQERRAHERCDWMVDPVARDRCFYRYR
jgi:hypothetical protein